MQALPAWTPLAIARSPVAVTVPDCRSVPAIMRSSQAKVRGPLCSSEIFRNIFLRISHFVRAVQKAVSDFPQTLSNSDPLCQDRVYV